MLMLLSLFLFLGSFCDFFTGRMTDSSGVVLGGLDRNKEKLQNVRNLLFTAAGTSLYASQYGAKLMRDMGAVDTCFAQVHTRVTAF